MKLKRRHMENVDYRNILLYRSMNLSIRGVAQKSGVNRMTVARVCKLADQKGIVWDTISKLSGDEIKAQLFGTSVSHQPKISVDMEKYLDWLSRDKTKTDCWEDYSKTANPINRLQRSQFYARLKAAEDEFKLKNTNSTSIRRHWLPAEYCQIDYAGDTIELELNDGSHIKINIFVGVLCFSNYCFAYATKGQRREHWIEAMGKMLIAFGGTPKFMLFDNAKALVKHPDPVNPILCSEVIEFAQYYKMDLTNTRIVSPRDKGAVENAVKQVQNEIKKHPGTYRSIEDIQNVLDYVCNVINTRSTKSLPLSRAKMWEQEKPFLGPLPDKPFTMGDTIKTLTVRRDNCVFINNHHYSAPYQYISRLVKCRITTDRQLQILDINTLEEIATHRYYEPDDFSDGYTHVKSEHLPAGKMTIEDTVRALYQALIKIGPDVEVFLAQCLTRKSWESKYQMLRFLQKLIGTYGKTRVNKACLTALFMERATVAFVECILKQGQEDSLATEANINQALIKRLRDGNFLRDAAEFDLIVRSSN